MKPETAIQRCDDGWRITGCRWGQLTLRLGAVRLDFTREGFARLHHLLDEASERLQTAVIDGQAAVSKTFMH